MNKLLTLILLLTTIVFTSCDPDVPRDVSKEYPATLEEIQGEWSCYNNAYTYHVTFNKNAYLIEITQVFNDEPLDMEYGTFEFDEAKLTLKSTSGESRYNTLEVYWNKEKSLLKILPLGAFTRVR